MHTNRIKSLILLLLLGFIWGTGYSIARFATTHGVSALGYSFWQAMGPAILIGLLVVITRKLRSYDTTFRDNNTTLTSRDHDTTPMSRGLSVGSRKRRLHFHDISNKFRNINYYFICSLTGIVIPNTNMYFAAPHLPAGLLAVIVNTVPIFVYLMSLSIRIESFNLLRCSGIACALTGLMLIILPHTSLPFSNMSFWVFSALLTPLSFACCAVYISKFRPAYSDSLSLAAGTLIISSIILLPIVLVAKSFYALHWPLTLPDSVILLEIILSSIGYILLFQLIKMAGPVYYSLVDTIVALTGLFWGYTIFHEKLNEWTSLAVLFILIALLLVTKRQPTVIEYSSPAIEDSQC